MKDTKLSNNQIGFLIDSLNLNIYKHEQELENMVEGGDYDQIQVIESKEEIEMNQSIIKILEGVK
jgi:hypothetical protein|tara:strand:- start:4 stop:198 length:195 start_codon:yes stop_codon:yes gene_type:complete